MAELRYIGWPMHLSNMPEIQAIDKASDDQCLKIAQALEDTEDDLLITTATEKGISRREKILGITPLDTDSLEDRRVRVLAAWYDSYPYTWLDLVKRLDKLCGVDGGYTANLDYDKQKLTVRIGLTQKSQYKAVCDLLERIVPVWIILDVDLLYNKWSDYSAKKWSDESTLTWKQAKEEVIK